MTLYTFTIEDDEHLRWTREQLGYLKLPDIKPIQTMTDIPRFWGIYDHSRKRWLVKSNGEPFHYPSPGVAQALLDNHLADNAHVVDGRGRSLTESLAVREMTSTTTTNDGS